MEAGDKSWALAEKKERGTRCLFDKLQLILNEWGAAKAKNDIFVEGWANYD
jgi:hypothetical protein